MLTKLLLLNGTTSYFNTYIHFWSKEKSFPFWESFFLLTKNCYNCLRGEKMTEDLSKRVEQAAQGITPQTKPDERRRYLGSLRERTLVRMNNTEIEDPKLTSLFLQHISDFKGYTILLNGKKAYTDFFNKIEEKCSKENIPFTLVNNETAKIGPEDTAVLVVAKTAINKMRIEINQVYPPEIPKMELTNANKEKKGFFKRLFHGDQK